MKIVTDFNHISPYAICFLSAFAIGFLIAAYIMYKHDIELGNIGLSCMLCFVMALWGGKTYGMLLSRQNFINAPIGSVGGLLGIVAAVMLFVTFYGQKKDIIIEAYMFVIPLMYGISKLGCHFAGCCYGIEYTGLLHIIYSGDGAPVGQLFPVQLLESTIFIMIFIVGVIIYRKSMYMAVCTLIILSGIAKAATEPLRHEYNGISANQIICMIFTGLGLACLIKRLKERNNGEY